MLKTVLILTTLILTFAAGAAETADAVNAKEIVLKKSFWSGWKFSADGGLLYMKVGTTGKDLRQFMDGHEEAQAEMDKYRSRAITGWICSAFSGGIIGWTLGEAGDNGWRDSHTQWMVGAAALLTVAILTDRSATGHLKEAVRLYNGEPGELSLSLGTPGQTYGDVQVYGAGIRWRF